MLTEQHTQYVESTVLDIVLRADTLAHQGKTQSLCCLFCSVEGDYAHHINSLDLRHHFQVCAPAALGRTKACVAFLLS